jgi:hypothetical protein
MNFGRQQRQKPTLKQLGEERGGGLGLMGGKGGRV